jgi:hypothetical protein
MLWINNLFKLKIKDMRTKTLNYILGLSLGCVISFIMIGSITAGDVPSEPDELKLYVGNVTCPGDTTVYPDVKSCYEGNETCKPDKMPCDIHE